MAPKDRPLTSIEICAGAGGQAIGLHQAGFKHLALVEIDKHAAETLEWNIKRRESWSWEREYCDVISDDVNNFRPIPSDDIQDSGLDKPVKFLGRQLRRGDLDLLAGGVPCPPFSHAGKQLGKDDERDLFPRMLELVDELHPKAVMIENVRGIKDAKFVDYRTYIEARLAGGRAKRPETGLEEDFAGLGYEICEWEVLEASDFGVPQLRPRAVLVAIRADVLGDIKFVWPTPVGGVYSVFDALEKSMEARYEPYISMGGKIGKIASESLSRWVREASRAALEKKDGGIAPTLVGGSKKHGGADLGPSRAKAAWETLGVSGMGVANNHEQGEKKKSQGRDLFGADGPMLTVEQAAIIQGFPKEWEFTGGKTAQYRQVGNAFPPPVAAAVGKAIADVLRAADERDAKTAAPRQKPLPGQVVPAFADGADDRQGAGV
ncbi:DNA (cytosine-5-)-methyltransferase [Streptomyces sp. SID4928]|uniref:DNA cytosine methyltransferase n=1 Tax=Streptomyces TaxID=1883 RepID=UPI0001C1BEA1|nr:DNA (cytosine-5-)-methyltransferase [Streptomyces sp. ACT-1]EGE44294.1 DNA-cytosine methyltransferase [Streptomyces sp. ACT-1]MYR52325.1 DNA (cytosine-5-)-methyltransferase [Streptomyces sp. SID4928]